MQVCTAQVLPKEGPGRMHTMHTASAVDSNCWPISLQPPAMACLPMCRRAGAAQGSGSPDPLHHQPGAGPSVSGGHSLCEYRTSIHLPPLFCLDKLLTLPLTHSPVPCHAPHTLWPPSLPVLQQLVPVHTTSHIWHLPDHIHNSSPTTTGTFSPTAATRGASCRGSSCPTRGSLACHV